MFSRGCSIGLVVNPKLHGLDNEILGRIVEIEMAKAMKVSNRTIINWCAALCKVWLLEPEVSGSRIRSYRVC